MANNSINNLDKIKILIANYKSKIEFQQPYFEYEKRRVKILDNIVPAISQDFIIIKTSGMPPENGIAPFMGVLHLIFILQPACGAMKKIIA